MIAPPLPAQTARYVMALMSFLPSFNYPVGLLPAELPPKYRLFYALDVVLRNLAVALLLGSFIRPRLPGGFCPAIIAHFRPR